MLRAGEQIDIIAKSKPWAKVLSMPSVKMIRQMAEAQMKNPPDPRAAQLLQLLQQPENQQLIALLNDMISHEVFCCGGENITGFIELLTVVNISLQLDPLIALLHR